MARGLPSVSNPQDRDICEIKSSLKFGVVAARSIFRLDLHLLGDGTIYPVPVSGTFGLDYRMRGGVVVAGASFSFKSGGDVRLAINQINYSVPTRELEMYVLYKYTPKLQFRVRLANVLRRDQVTASTYFNETGSTRSSSIRPTQMNVGANVKLDF